MNTAPDRTDDVPHQVIREKIAAFNERERDLCKQAYEAYKSGASASITTVSNRDRTVYDRAKALLNGAHSLLGELPEFSASPNQMQSIETELAAVRLALETLNRADLQKEATEVANWAVENTPAWRVLVRNHVLAVAALIQAEAACGAFLDAAGGGRANALPYRYHLNSSPEVLDFAVRDGLVKASEIKGARSNA